MICIDKWYFTINNCPFNIIGKSKTVPQILQFHTAKSFCEYISIHGNHLQPKIKEILSSQKSYQNWKAKSPFLKDIPFYSNYRCSTRSKTYHRSVQNIINGTSTLREKTNVSGLCREIERSTIILPKGQKLFYGFSYSECPSSKKIFELNKFLSCTLCPEVAAYHAITKGHNSKKGVVMILSLSKDFPAIFGVRGKLSHEQEMLLNCNSRIKIDAIHNIQSGAFDVVEATLLGFNSINNKL